MQEIQLKSLKNQSNQICLIDEADYDLVKSVKWYAVPRTRCDGFYVRGRFNRRMQDIHRVILGLGVGDKRNCDHVNGNGLDNGRSNLRIATASQNQANRRISKNNSSGYKGVFFHNPTQQWCSQIVLNGRRKHLGYFESPRLAAVEYDKYSSMIHGNFANLNFKQEAPNKEELCNL